MKPIRGLVLIVILLSVIYSAITAAAPEITFSAGELVFSGVQDKVTIPTQTLTITNTGDAPLTITDASVTGTDSLDFTVINPPVLPVALAAGENLALTVQFAPRLNEIGIQTAALHVASDDADEASVDLGLYGLSAKALEAGNEPSLHRVVTTFGYKINVGKTGLILGTDPNPIGDEVLVPLFQKASANPVVILPVARFSPHMQIPYGYYFPNGSTPITNQVAVMSANVPYSQQYPPNHQTLNPWLDAGSSTMFDPGTAAFGIYVLGLEGRYTYTEDALNANNPTLHGARIYPLKDRAGTPIPNGYLVAFEDAANGDYQDYVFALFNVAPAGSSTPTETPIPPTATPTPLPPMGVELITNGSFEVDANGDNVPDGWTLTGMTDDQRLCGTGGAYAGNCAMNFKNSASENALIEQQKNAPAGMGAGDTVNLSVYTKATSKVAGRIKVVIIYTDLTKDYIDLALQASPNYQHITASLVLSKPVKRVKFLTRHRSTKPNIELWVDSVSVTWDDTNLPMNGVRDNNGIIPLPEAPSVLQNRQP